MIATHIPKGAWMRLKQHGRQKYSRNTKPIIWQTKDLPPKGATVYVIGWRDGQQHLQASSTYIQP